MKTFKPRCGNCELYRGDKTCPVFRNNISAQFVCICWFPKNKNIVPLLRRVRSNQNKLDDLHIEADEMSQKQSKDGEILHQIILMYKEQKNKLELNSIRV